MHFTNLGMFLYTEDPRAAADFYIQHLGFKKTTDIGWFVALRHPDHPNFDLALAQNDHKTVAAPFKGIETKGAGLAFLVKDVDAEAARLREAGVAIAVEVQSEPWGQRRFQFEAPGGVIVEILQQVEPSVEWLEEHGLTAV